MTTAVVHRRSALEAFRCPRRYKALYLDGVPDESDPARRGSAFHDAARRYTLALQRLGKTDDYELAADCLKAALAENLVPAHLVGEVTDLFWRWAESFELDLDALLVVEERQRSSEGYSWTPDLVYARGDVVDIRDYKTHFQAFSETQAQQEFQSRFYVWQARKLWPGFQRYHITFVFVRWGVEVSAEFDQADIDTFEAQVEATVAAIEHARETNTWPAIPGQQCSYCTLTCPIVEHPEKVEARLITRADAERMGAIKLALDRAAKLADEALRGWCAANGPLVVGGMEFSHRPAPTTHFAIADVMRVLDEQGITPTFTVSKSTLRPYLETKKFAHVRPHLEPLAQVKPGTRFGARKAGAVTDEAED